MIHYPYNNSMRWFEGVVESRQDPLKLGRVQVRVFGVHTDNLVDIPSKDLHWMNVMHPVTSSANSGVSETPKLVEGTSVIGFFRDGNSCQDGVVLGSVAGIPQDQRNANKGFNDLRGNLSPTNVPGKPANVNFGSDGVSITESTRTPFPRTLDEPDLSRLARNENAFTDTINATKQKSQVKDIPMAGGGSFSEPAVPYATVYPYNSVSESESGHVLEFDDTPSKERVHLAHRAGSFIEMHNDGSVVYKSAKVKFDISHSSSYSYVNGSQVVTVRDGSKLLVNSSGGGGSLEIEVGSGGSININVKDGNINMSANGDINIECDGDFSVNAKTINLN